MAYIQVPKESYLEKNLVDNIYLKKKLTYCMGLFRESKWACNKHLHFLKIFLIKIFN